MKDPACIPRKETSMALALKKALEPVICRHEFPYFQLEIKVIILDDDGCALSTAINCCGAALVDAGIAIYDLITASTVCKYKDVEFVNPNGIADRFVVCRFVYLFIIGYFKFSGYRTISLNNNRF